MLCFSRMKTIVQYTIRCLARFSWPFLIGEELILLTDRLHFFNNALAVDNAKRLTDHNFIRV